MTNRAPLMAIAAAFFLLMLAGTYGWLAQGSSLLLTLAETGLSWCF